jgi:hypothetical protein
MPDWRCLRKCAGLLAVLMSFAMPAAELTDLYQATVPAAQSQAQWQRQALAAVLLKLTGSPDAQNQPGLADALKNSGQFVVQFQQVQFEGQSQLLVTLDGQKITRLLQSLQIPVWGPRRPDVLLWLTERPVDTPQFVASPDHPLRKALLSQAGLSGLSLQFPLLDETDTTLVNEAASWGGDWALLQQASMRYQATEVYNLLFDQITDASGLVQFRLTWQQLVDGAVQSHEIIHADAMVLAQQFCAELARTQAARYAVRIAAPGASTAQRLQLTVDGVSSLTDLARLRQLFGAMLTVREQHLVQYSAGQAVLALQLSASAEEFYRALSLVRELTPQAEASTDSTGTTTAPVLSDAEAAMDAALADSAVSESPAVPESAVALPPDEQASATAHSASTPLVYSTRYLFRRQ